ncbi:MAG: hypothetical protein ACREVA_07725, partial [Burkholderiales bacterium]
VIVDAQNDYRQERLAPYVGLLTQRFGKKNLHQATGPLLPEKIRQTVAMKLMRTNWFARHIIIDRWFLHAGQPAML